MKWMLMALFVVWSGTVTFAEAPPNLHKDSSKKDPVTERLLMQGTEIQGTVEKPHVVYIIPWKKETDQNQQEIQLERSFMMEILEPVDYGRFQRQWGEHPRTSKGGEKR